MKTKIKISGYILRGAAGALLLSCVIAALSSAINLPNHPTRFPAPQNDAASSMTGHENAASAIQRNRTLTFADRVAYQRAIEDIYWRHRIWPEANAEPKPPLDKVMSQAEIQKKVEDYLRDSQALEDYWQRPITPDQLQAEMERMASHTKQARVLREIFAALGNDPFVIAECLARPVLAERLVTELMNEDRVKLTRIAWREQPLQSWVAKAETQVLVTMAAVSADYALPAIPGQSDNWSPSVGCTDNTWTPTSTTNAAAGRAFHTAVWTGSEMIVWGGYGTGTVSLNTGGRYNPSTDSWAATSITGAPSARFGHTAVWTGSQMIVWGGGDVDGTNFNTGGKYNPNTNAWTPTSLTNVPEVRRNPTAVWTGSEMIVWGGENPGFLNTGGRYNPGTDSWTATSTTNAPVGRVGHTAVWAGSEMIVWGGDGNFGFFNDGGRYNPSTDSWTATSTTNAPDPRGGHTAVWTGTQMIVWGGLGADYFNTGGRYNPLTDSWTATSTANAPDGRFEHNTVWTGTEMIVWGGYGTGTVPINTGGRYNPSTDSWTATSTTNAPEPRVGHKAVWTGNQMIVWGGVVGCAPTCVGLNTGGRYCAATTGPPSPPTAHPATYIASNSFTANWSSVMGATGYRLDVSTSSSFNTYVTGYQNLNVGNATSRSVTGLNASTTYYYRVRAYNGHGTSGNSNIVSVTTLSPTGPPVVVTNPATLIASFSATLNGSVDPHGLTTTVHFEYGTTTSYGQTTANQTKTGNAYQSVAANISGLAASATYHFRIVATNSAGTVHGSDRTFTTLSATGPPVVITNPATLIASFSATLNGSVDPHGLTTTVYFQYGTTTSYGLTTANQSKSGNTYQNAAANISGLSASTTYHFRIVATNSAGTTYGADRTFITLSATGSAVVITNPATLIASFSGTLNGSVDPHGLTTTVYFQYGTTTSYGLTTATQSKTGNTYQNVAGNISGLTASTTYHFRIVATNSAGTTYGADRTFTTLSATGPPVTITNPATNLASSSATLNGSVDPHGLSTSVHFQYGTTTGYGSTTPFQTKTGNTYQNVAANISGLTAGSTYHFRIVATNSSGTTNGSDRTFTTP